jgi:hypothetical protein
LAASVLGLTCLLAACSDGPEQPPEVSDSPSHIVVSLPPEPPGIRMSFLQQRIWEGTRRADVRIINITDRLLGVRKIGLEWPGYPGSPQRFPVRVAAGQTLDLHYRLPDPDCSADPEAPATGVAVTGTGTIRREIDAAGRRFLTRIWTSDCALLRVGDLVDISYDVPDPADAADIPPGGGLDSTLPVTLRLTRRAPDDPEAVNVETILGTVLFDLTLSEPGQGLGRGQRSAGVPVVVDPGRCDEHARSQASQPFTFRLGLRIGEDPEPVSVIVVPEPPARLRLLAFLDAACGDRTAHQ